MTQVEAFQGRRIAFRVDASVSMGIGHLMRCLTLADALRQAGAECFFMTRLHSGHGADLIEQRGYPAHRLAAPNTNGQSVSPGNYSAWLGVTPEADAEEVARILDHQTVNWIVVDHYALDARWENRIARAGQRLLVIDDLADRLHQCDLLLDQTLGRQARDYEALLPSTCSLLLGTDFALLRPQFSAQRAAALARRRATPLRHLLVSLGGSDPDNVTAEVLRSLAHCNLGPELNLTVVMGAHAPHLAEVKTIAAQLPWKTEVLVAVGQMAPLMATADIAIGAAGTTSWERCCLGLPAVVVLMAENQRLSGQQLQRADAIALIDGVAAIARELPGQLDAVLQPTVLIQMSRSAAALVDGIGTQRVVQAMMQCMNLVGIRLRQVERWDSRTLYRWQCQPGARRFFHQPTQPSWTEHRRWFTRLLANVKTQMYLIEFNGQAAGYLRLDWRRLRQAEVSILVSNDYRGQGLAARALAMLENQHAGVELVAQVRAGNRASKKTFNKAGFKPAGAGRYVKHC